jgi:hypothetical protein
MIQTHGVPQNSFRIQADITVASAIAVCQAKVISDNLFLGAPWIVKLNDFMKIAT